MTYAPSGFVGGFFVGTSFVGWAWVKCEEKAVRAGFLVISNVIYRLVPAKIDS